MVLENAELPEYCMRNSADPVRVWVDNRFILPFKSLEYEECWYRYVSLKFNETVGEFHSAKGVNVKPVEYCGSGDGFGTAGIDYLISLFGYEVYSYYGAIFDALMMNGFVKGKHLWGAPYDWRLSARALQKEFYPDLKNLIEKIYALNDGQKVSIVGHSHGNLVIVNFLNTLSDKWKDKYIAGYIAVSGPWGGTSKTLRDLLSGDDVIGNNWYENTFDIFKREMIQKLAQGYGSLNTLLPSPYLYQNFPIIRFEHLDRNFTGYELIDILEAGNCPDQIEIFKFESNFYETIKPPGVPMYCTAGAKILTEKNYVYHKDPILDYPDFYCGDGDGTVTIESLRICQWWQTLDANRGYPLEYTEYPGRDHNTILNDEIFLRDFFQMINNIPT
jgi:lecithin-cholesterol acyltransferase